MPRPVSAATMFLVALALPGAARGQSPPNLDVAVLLVESQRFAEAKPPLLALAAREPGNTAAAYWAGRVLIELGEPDPGRTRTVLECLGERRILGKSSAPGRFRRMHPRPSS